MANSYYLADGVKLFSQETWRLFMGEAGREMVGKYAQDVTDYYCMASELDNHCVRESACHSIAEMAEKVRVGTAVLLYRCHHYSLCSVYPAPDVIYTVRQSSSFRARLRNEKMIVLALFTLLVAFCVSAPLSC